MKEENGWLALDVDGTLTSERYSIPVPTVNYLRLLVGRGWKLIILTGRTFSFASPALSALDFPYFLAVQNGSLILEMPKKETLFHSYLDRTTLTLIKKAFEGLDGTLAVYSGRENNDRCYFLPDHLSPETLKNIEDMKNHGTEEWFSIKGLQEIPVDNFPLIKGIGSFDRMTRLAERLEATGLVQLSLIRDPFDSSNYLLLITAKGVTKGGVIKTLIEKKGRGGVIIAAGNDDNDTSLLEAADVRVAMADSPSHLLDLADLIAPPPQEYGIVFALQQAIGKFSHQRRT